MPTLGHKLSTENEREVLYAWG